MGRRQSPASSAAPEEVVRTKRFSWPHPRLRSRSAAHGIVPTWFCTEGHGRSRSKSWPPSPHLPPRGRWRPQPHAAVLDFVKETLGEFGYTVVRRSGTGSRATTRGTSARSTSARRWSRASPWPSGSDRRADKSFPLGFAAGSRVFCCDNLSFNAELMVKRKHTTNSDVRFRDDIAQAVNRLSGYRELETARIARMQETEVPPETGRELSAEDVRAWHHPRPAPAAGDPGIPHARRSRSSRPRPSGRS